MHVDRVVIVITSKHVGEGEGMRYGDQLLESRKLEMFTDN